MMSVFSLNACSIWCHNLAAHDFIIRGLCNTNTLINDKANQLSSVIILIQIYANIHEIKELSIFIYSRSYFSVFVIFSDSEVLRDFLYAADELLMTEGDHVFITMELFPSDWLGYYTQFERGIVYCKIQC